MVLQTSENRQKQWYKINSTFKKVASQQGYLFKILKQYITNATPGAYSEPSQASSLGLFVKIVRDWMSFECA